MPHQLSSFNANLAESIIANASIAVTLARGVNSASIQAAIDIVDYPYENTETGVSFTWEAVDFLIKPQDYNAGAGVIVPQRGDTITYTDEVSDVILCTVNFIPGEQPYIREPWRHLMRVHTKST